MNASDDIQVSGSGLSNSGTLYAQRDMKATVSGQLNNAGMIVAARHTSVGAGEIDSSKKGVFGAGVKNAGSLGKAAI